MSEHGSVASSIVIPASAQGCRERLALLRDEIASIRIQIATSDIRRQAERRSIDAAWFHRARTALRLKQQELTLVSAQLAKLAPSSARTRRDRFKDTLIDVLRGELDGATWERALHTARTRLGTPEASDG